MSLRPRQFTLPVFAAENHNALLHAQSSPHEPPRLPRNGSLLVRLFLLLALLVCVGLAALCFALALTASNLQGRSQALAGAPPLFATARLTLDGATQNLGLDTLVRQLRPNAEDGEDGARQQLQRAFPRWYDATGKVLDVERALLDVATALWRVGAVGAVGVNGVDGARQNNGVGNAASIP